MEDFGIVKAQSDGMDVGWGRVGRAVEKRVTEELKVTWESIYEDSGVSEPTVSKLRKGQPLVQPAKVRGLCQALGWSDDSLDRIRRGKAPVVIQRARDAGTARRLQNRMTTFEQRLDDELATLRARLDAIDRRLASGDG